MNGRRSMLISMGLISNTSREFRFKYILVAQSTRFVLSLRGCCYGGTISLTFNSSCNHFSIHRFLPTNCLSVFDYFVRLALKGLKRWCKTSSPQNYDETLFLFLVIPTLKVLKRILSQTKEFGKCLYYKMISI